MPKNHRDGFTIIEILIVVAIIALISSIALLNYLTTNKASSKVICRNNLKQIDAAIDQWAIDYAIEAGATPSQSQQDEINTYIEGGLPRCPSRGQYTYGAVGSTPQVVCGNEGSEGHRLSEE